MAIQSSPVGELQANDRFCLKRKQAVILRMIPPRLSSSYTYVHTHIHTHASMHTHIYISIPMHTHTYSHTKKKRKLASPASALF